MEELSNKIIKRDKRNNIELGITESTQTSLVYEKDKLLYPHFSHSKRMIIRVTLPDGRTGVATTSRTDTWEETLKQATKLARISEKDRHFKGLPVEDTKASVKLFEPALLDMSVEDLGAHAKLMLDMVKHAKVSMHGLWLGTGHHRVLVANSNGVSNSHIRAGVSMSLDVIKNNITGSSGHMFVKQPNPGKVAKEAIDECLKSQNPKPIQTGTYPVVLEHEALQDVIGETLVSALNGYALHKGDSFFSHKIGEKVASPKLSIVDDATIEYGLGSYESDSEGVGAKKTVLIEKGVLKSGLYDYYTANLAKRKSTGNCSSLTARPAIGASNVVIARGTASRSDIISGIKKGVLVSSVSGAHMSNPVSGDFSNELAKAYAIENGEVTHAISSGMISGNVFDTIKKINAIGSEPIQKSAFIAPLILFKGMQFIA